MSLCRCMDIRLLALVAVGGAIGASLRYSVQSSFEPDSGPYATAGVNLLGSLLLGSIFGAIAAGTALSEGAMAVFATGVLGSFTTMSAFAIDYLEFFLLYQLGFCFHEDPVQDCIIPLYHHVH